MLFHVEQWRKNGSFVGYGEKTLSIRTSCRRKAVWAACRFLLAECVGKEIKTDFSAEKTEEKIFFLKFSR